MAGKTADQATQILASIGYEIPQEQIQDYAQLLEKTRTTLDMIMAMDDYQPHPDIEAAPRLNVHFPMEKENPLKAWAWKCHCSQNNPATDLLKNKTICLKDNIALAGVPCLLGTSSFTDWTPTMDATVVSRILDNGGILLGKAVCENLSRGAVSCTAATGPIDNPYARGYTAGGSSSGTAALLASGEVDMGIGCDQGGSIRIPASMCGLYGFKATTGLVPYTGIVSNDATVDYVGPMTKTCMDCAALLQAIAGVDFLDDRQIAGCPFPQSTQLKYTEALARTNVSGARGLKIGILKEGLDSQITDAGVKCKFMAAAMAFEQLGATVTEVSIPMHTLGCSIYAVMSKMANHMGMLGRATGRRQVMLTDLIEKKSIPHSHIEKMNTVSIEGLLSGEYSWTEYPLAYAKSINLNRRMRDEYNSALKLVDLIIMPTTMTQSTRLPGKDATPLEHITASIGKLENTAPINGTGHPALAMPIGFVPAKDDTSLMLPASMQIVGKYWDEERILQTAYAWELTNDWKIF